MSRRVLVVFLCVLAEILLPLEAGALSPEKVLVGPKDQGAPTSNGVYLGWSEWTRTSERAYIMKLGTQGHTLVNAPRTGGSMGSFVGSSDTLIYQQFRGRRSDLYFYDVNTKTRTRISAPVNTSDWEYWPVASDTYILFVRLGLRPGGKAAWRRVMLYDRVTSKLVALTGRLKIQAFLDPTFAGDTYVSWTTCAKHCDVWVWSAADGTTRLSNPGSKDQEGGVIDEATGTLYYSHASATRCGRGGSIMKTVIGSGISTELTGIPTGFGVGSRRSLTLNPVTGHLDLYFSRYRCSGRVQPSGRIQADIYVFRGVDQ